MNVHLRIDVLVLDGMVALDEPLLVEALRGAIEARLEAGTDMPRYDGAIEALNARALTSAEGTPRAVAEGIASSVSQAVLP